jgi:IS30 family transposase
MYRAHTAQRRADRWAATPRKPRTLDVEDRLKEYILTNIRAWWSPQQIAARLVREYPENMAMRISHEAIYAYVYVLPRGTLRKELIGYLRQHRKQRGKRVGKSKDTRGQIPRMISIEERPVAVADRTIPGHWEGDLIVGPKNRSALGTLVERTTRWTLIVPLGKRHDAQTVRRAFARKLRQLPKELTQTLTYDQGKEMSEHERFTVDTGIHVYFAHPHSPWERGTNENTNGLIRQFFPKGTDLSMVSRREVQKVQDLLNGRPRQVLQFATPTEAFQELLSTTTDGKVLR